MKNRIQNLERLHQLIGYPPQVQPTPRVQAVLDQAISLLLAVVQPNSIKQMVSLEKAHDLCSGKRIRQSMRNADQVLLFAMTLGPFVDHETKKLAQKDGFLAYLFDVVASHCAETCIAQLHQAWDEEMNTQGLFGGYRFSPGYCDWPQPENKRLIGAVNATCINIQLTSSGMMVPKKSISGCIAFHQDQNQGRHNPCLVCKRQCNHRRKPNESPY